MQGGRIERKRLWYGSKRGGKLHGGDGWRMGSWKGTGNMQELGRNDIWYLAMECRQVDNACLKYQYRKKRFIVKPMTISTYVIAYF